MFFCGGLSGWSPVDRATVVSAGGAWWFWSPPYPACSLLYCPHPPDPLPGGKGEALGYFMQGAPPLASPRPSRKQHGLNLRCRYPLGWLIRLVAGRPCRCGVRRGVGGFGRLLTVPLWCPQGVAWRFWSPANPAFSFLYCPHPPAPFPSGEGGDFYFISPGAKPPAPLH